ncbi:MAG: thioredoxin family protein [Phycisphaerae bacterium]|nr:thioredoxin family protein [Phycisphaerae bacterium]
MASCVALVAAMAWAASMTVGQTAPAFTLTDQNGKSVSLSDYAGKLVVLEWFNDGCPFVQRHYNDGDMNATAKAYAAKGVVWLAINSTHSASASSDKSIADKWSIDRPILSDTNGTVGHAYGATNTPEIFVIGKDGKIDYFGAIDNNPQGDKSASEVTNYVARALDEVLAGKPVSEPQTKPYGCSVKYAS